ncbi:unnamed protein product [Brassica rapa]|uniref:NAD(P)H dehydrogenase (quinone) n=1 Tax=Brassica campestris TaxID=3711 RepID=A0A8D9MFC2_BRACM|nr:unnamed protein product [Brassica rapa]
MATPQSSTRPTHQNPQPTFHDLFPAMAGKLGGEGLIDELCKGFELLMDGDKGVITFESLRRNASAVLGLGDLTDDDVRCMIDEGDFDRDGALNQMEFCVLMFRLSPDLMDASRFVVTEAIEEEFETLPEEALLKMSAPPKSGSPIITPNDLTEADGFVLGFPTRFGMMAAQFKAFLDATGGLWRTQALAGKPAGIFYSTGSQGGGQETTALTAITQLVHHGMIFVPIGYTFGAGMFEMEKVKGGSPYGAGTFAGDGSRQPTQLELEQAFHQGKYIATITKKLKVSTV